MDKTIKLLPPKMPDEIYFETPPRVRQDGFHPRQGILVKDLSPDEALEYAELMKQTFLEHYGRLTGNLPTSRQDMDLSFLKGLNERSAAYLCKNLGFQVTVIRRGSEHYFQTTDLNFNRIGFILNDDGIVLDFVLG